jgi:YHS domain-containing protein
MKVDRAKAIHVDFANQTFYFCSQHCLHAFEADPAKHFEHGSSTGETISPETMPIATKQEAP